MKEYDVIVIGSGSGMSIVSGVLNHGLKVALVDKGPLGGTCLNVGCIPSKMLIYPADRIVEIQEAKKLGITAEIKDIDFKSIMERMKGVVDEGVSHMREGLKHVPNLDYYETEGHFVEDYTLEVNGEKIKGDKIFIVSGARPLIPPIKGIEEVDYLTNETVLELKERPESMIIIGGGYIACEFGHFFAAMGTKVTILQRNVRLVKNEEPEISELLKKEMSKRMEIHTNIEVVEAKKTEKGITIVGRDKTTGEQKEFTAEKILIASGRKSNADLLKVENTGVETDKRGYIIVNEYFETNKKNIWACGDAIGKYMFKHTANEEADLMWSNAIHGEHSGHGEKVPMDYWATPHAVFSYPQIAAVGLTEEEAKKEYDILVGMAEYSSVAKGEAMVEETSFAKAIIEKNTWRILGFHIIGPYAPMLIQEVINAMASDGTLMPIARAQHIHPALPELILRTFSRLREPE